MSIVFGSPPLCLSSAQIRAPNRCAATVEYILSFVVVSWYILCIYLNLNRWCHGISKHRYLELIYNGALRFSTKITSPLWANIPMTMDIFHKDSKTWSVLTSPCLVFMTKPRTSNGSPTINVNQDVDILWHILISDWKFKRNDLSNNFMPVSTISVLMLYCICSLWR